MIMPRTAILLSASVIFAGSIPGANAQTAIERARAGEVRQGQIQTDAQRLAADLDSMIDEYDRNGLSGDDIKNLKSLRAILGRLSEKEMVKILNLLREAGSKSDPKTALTAITRKAVKAATRTVFFRCADVKLRVK